MLKIDLHIHTIASGHAFSTIYEIVEYAKKKKMKVIGISDHGPALESSRAHPAHFWASRLNIPDKIDGLRILKSIEANILDSKGNLDIEEKTLERLDYAIAGIHYATGYKDQGIKKNTLAVLNAMKKKKVKILAHPYLYKHYKIDIKEVSEAACKNNVLLEVTTKTFRKERFLDNKIYHNKLRKMIAIVKKNNKKVIVNSDSHSVWNIGDDSEFRKWQKRIGLTDDMIINNYPKELEKILGVKF